MIVLPAIDLREGQCVQLVGGSYDAERVRIPDVVRQAEHFRDAGFRRLHVVDLDAATGRGENRAVIERLLAVPGLELQVGGGVRDRARAEALLAAGARAVVVGTRALEQPELLAELAGAHPGKIIVALDVNGREVLLRGWAEGSGRRIEDALDDVKRHALAGVLVTAVHKEGALGGSDHALYRDIVPRAGALPVLASGGVASLADLEALEAASVAGVVVGMALYTGALEPSALARFS